MGGAEANVEEESDDSAGVMQDLDIRRPRSARNGAEAFFKDKSWSMFASNNRASSYGTLGKTILARRKHRYKMKADWAFSDNAQPSGVSIMSYANQKRVVTRKRSPTRYNEGQDRDPPRIHKILNPSFRSFRGAHKGRSIYQRYAADKERRALKAFYRIAQVNPKTGRFRKDDDSNGMYNTFTMTEP